MGSSRFPHQACRGARQSGIVVDTDDTDDTDTLRIAGSDLARRVNFMKLSVVKERHVISVASREESTCKLLILVRLDLCQA